MSQMLDQNNEMRASLRELRGQLSHTHSQLDALQAATDEVLRVLGGGDTVESSPYTYVYACPLAFASTLNGSLDELRVCTS